MKPDARPMISFQVHQYAIRAEASLRALVAMLARWKTPTTGGVAELSAAERAKVPKVMEDAWAACLFYINGFMCGKERRRVSAEGRACTDSSRIIWSVMEDVYQRISCDLVPLLAPPGLDNRMLSCMRLSMQKMKRDEKSAETFKLLHPCNITLRSLMGFPTIDVMTVEAHKKLGGMTTFHLDPLTDFITGRWYTMVQGDKGTALGTAPGTALVPCTKASFMGGIPSTCNEALITTIYCGGDATVASGYNPHGPFLGGMEVGCLEEVFFVSLFVYSTHPREQLVTCVKQVGPPCAWFPGQDCVPDSMGDYMKGKRELIIWSAVEGGLEEEETNCGPAEWAIVMIRCNFMSLFNESEGRDASGMMLPTWGANTRVKGRNCDALACDAQCVDSNTRNPPDDLQYPTDDLP